MAIVNSTGTVEGIIKSVLMANGGTQEDPNGRFYIDGQMINVELSRTIAEAVYLNEMFLPGFNANVTYTEGATGGSTVRVPLQALFKPSSRTLSYGGRQGTPNNSGIFNKNEPKIPATSEFLVYINQINDQDLVFPDIAKEYIPLDLMARQIASYGSSVGQDRSASTLAEILGYNMHRAMNAGGNIVPFDASQDYAYSNLIADLNTKFSNGDVVTSVTTFGVEGRVIMGRPGFINNIFKQKSGVILNGNDLAQKMLREMDLSVGLQERGFVGQFYRGEFGRLHFVEVPDLLWTFAERYLGLADGALAGVQAVAYHYDSLALGKNVDLGVKLQDTDSRLPRGIMARPLNLWGHEMFRKGFIIGDSTFTTDYLASLGMTDATRLYPCAPEDIGKGIAGLPADDTIEVPIYGEDGTIIGYKRIASVQEPSGGNVRSGLKKVATPVATPVAGTYSATQSVTLTSSTSGATIYYTTDGSTPTKSSTKYTAAISVAATTTIKAIAIKTGMVESEVLTAAYTISA